MGRSCFHAWCASRARQHLSATAPRHNHASACVSDGRVLSSFPKFLSSSSPPIERSPLGQHAARAVWRQPLCAQPLGRAPAAAATPAAARLPAAACSTASGVYSAAGAARFQVERMACRLGRFQAHRRPLFAARRRFDAPVRLAHLCSLLQPERRWAARQPWVRRWAYPWGEALERRRAQAALARSTLF